MNVVARFVIKYKTKLISEFLGSFKIVKLFTKWRGGGEMVEKKDRGRGFYDDE